MKVIILWSGGWDSTAVLINALNCGHDVTAVNIGLECNTLQKKKEGLAVDKIYNDMTQHGHKFELRKTTINIASSCKRTLTQPALWALALSMSIKHDEYYDYLASGYIEPDCFWHVRQHFEDCVRSNIKCCGLDSSIKDFKYPFEWEDKQYVYEYVKSWYPSIMKYITTCENPRELKGNLRNCGTCKKCKEFKSLDKSAT